MFLLFSQNHSKIKNPIFEYRWHSDIIRTLDCLKIEPAVGCDIKCVFAIASDCIKQNFNTTQKMKIENS